MNLQLIKKSQLKTGSIFAMFLPDGLYLFGKVVDAKVQMMGGSVALLYIYAIRSRTLDVDTDSLTPDALLLPPVFVFPAFWSKGYTVKVKDSSIKPQDLIRQHCFLAANNTYVDEYGNEVAPPTDTRLCGKWSITSIGSLDDQISDALGIKRAPLQENDIYHIAGMTGEKIIHKKSDAELKKYVNYEWIIKNHPEVIKENE